MSSRQCIKCSDTFEAPNWNKQKYCSQECFNTGKKLKRVATCSHCNTDFQYSDKVKREKDAIWCKSCTAKNCQIQYRYGISLYQYEDMRLKQDGACAICKTGYQGKQLSVDHCHTTGKVRGLLCDNCNNSIAKFDDNPQLLQNAILYLIKHQQDNTWDRYFINMAALVASRSKDVSVQVGAVLTQDKTIISTGFNGFPRNCDDEKLMKLDRPEKYEWICHAEENAIINCTRNAVASNGGTIYITPMYPCAKCARAIVQAGIQRVVCQATIKKEKWTKAFEVSKQMFDAANIEFVEID